MTFFNELRERVSAFIMIDDFDYYNSKLSNKDNFVLYFNNFLELLETRILMKYSTMKGVQVVNESFFVRFENLINDKVFEKDFENFFRKTLDNVKKINIYKIGVDNWKIDMIFSIDIDKVVSSNLPEFDLKLDVVRFNVLYNLLPRPEILKSDKFLPYKEFIDDIDKKLGEFLQESEGEVKDFSSLEGQHIKLLFQKPIPKSVIIAIINYFSTDNLVFIILEDLQTENGYLYVVTFEKGEHINMYRNVQKENSSALTLSSLYLPELNLDENLINEHVD
jgi:hypothetical protein